MRGAPARRRRARRPAALPGLPASLALPLLLALFVSLAGCRDGAGAAPSGPPPEGWVTIRDQRIAVELAETPAEQSLGLGERDSLAWGHGMYFPYARPGYYAFWMKGMRFSIDIVWLRHDRIVDISPNVPFVEGSNGPTVRPLRPVDAVLEVPAGYATAHGWRPGDKVGFERVAKPSTEAAR